MTENKQELVVSPLEYGYTPDQVTEIPAIALTNFLYFLDKVLESQPRQAVPYVFPQNVELINDADGNLAKVNANWTAYDETNSKAFFNSLDNYIPIATELSVLAEQLKFAILNVHQANIQAGLAKKISDNVDDNQVNSILD